MIQMTPTMIYQNAQEAFEDQFQKVNANGEQTGNGTKTMFNVGFYMNDPIDNEINTSWRKWSKRYAEREWTWYQSQNRSVEQLKKFAPIWDKMHNGNNIVNSNYGWQWNRDDQLAKTIEQLRSDPLTRHAWITIFNGREKDTFTHDTPCTLNLGFQIVEDQLCMSVTMRSNDLWYGFCNDQYCFSKLQSLIAGELGIDVGWYYHWSANLHIYERNYGKGPQ